VEVGHLAGVAAIDPFSEEAQLRMIGGWRDAAQIKPQRPRMRLDRGGR
jgi:hypothetical protein